MEYRIPLPQSPSDNENPIAQIEGMDELLREHFVRKQPLPVIVLTANENVRLHLSEYSIKTLSINDLKLLTPTLIDSLMACTKKVVLLADLSEQDQRKIALANPPLYITALRPIDFGSQCPEHPTLQEFFSRSPDPKKVERLLNRARKAQFWEEIYDKNTGEITGYALSQTELSYFLQLHGYVELKDNTQKQPTYVHIDGRKVEAIYAKDIVTFMDNWAENEGISIQLTDKLHSSRILPTDNENQLATVDGLDFSSATSTSQLFYFRNVCVKVTAEGIEVCPYDSLTGKRYVWSDCIIPHDFRPMAPQFTLQTDGLSHYYIEITPGAPSKLMHIVKQMSRLYWRKTDEQGLPLTAEEQRQQEQNFFAICCAIGYLLHRHKSPSAAYAILFLDGTMTSSPKDLNGRNGKSFLMKVLGAMTNSEPIDMRAYLEKSNKQFALANVTEKNGLVLLDEWPKNYSLKNLFGKITGHLEVEKKGKDVQTIPFERSPKFVVGSNFLPNKCHDQSTEARFCEIVVSDYFHVQTETNDYKETRTVRDEFDQDLWIPDYSIDDRQADIHFLLECEQMYLSLPVQDRRQPSPREQMRQREMQAAIDETVMSWATEHLQAPSDYLDHEVLKKKLYDDFCEDTKSEMAQATFTTNLKQYCKLHGLEYNPKGQTNTKDGRIVRKSPENMKSVEYVYIASKSGNK